MYNVPQITETSFRNHRWASTNRAPENSTEPSPGVSCFTRHRSVYLSLSIQSPTTCAENHGEIQCENQRLVSDTNKTKTSAQNYLENHPRKPPLISPIGTTRCLQEGGSRSDVRLGASRHTCGVELTMAMIYIVRVHEGDSTWLVTTGKRQGGEQ